MSKFSTIFSTLENKHVNTQQSLAEEVETVFRDNIGLSESFDYNRLELLENKIVAEAVKRDTEQEAHTFVRGIYSRVDEGFIKSVKKMAKKVWKKIKDFFTNDSKLAVQEFNTKVVKYKKELNKSSRMTEAEEEPIGEKDKPKTKDELLTIFEKDRSVLSIVERIGVLAKSNLKQSKGISLDSDDFGTLQKSTVSVSTDGTDKKVTLSITTPSNETINFMTITNKNITYSGNKVTSDVFLTLIKAILLVITSDKSVLVLSSPIKVASGSQNVLSIEFENLFGKEAPTDGKEAPTDGKEAPTDGKEAPTDGKELEQKQKEVLTQLLGKEPENVAEIAKTFGLDSEDKLDSVSDLLSDKDNVGDIIKQIQSIGTVEEQSTKLNELIEVNKTAFIYKAKIIAEKLKKATHNADGTEIEEDPNEQKPKKISGAPIGLKSYQVTKDGSTRFLKMGKDESTLELIVTTTKIDAIFSIPATLSTKPQIEFINALITTIKEKSKKDIKVELKSKTIKIGSKVLKPGGKSVIIVFSSGAVKGGDDPENQEDPKSEESKSSLHKNAEAIYSILYPKQPLSSNPFGIVGVSVDEKNKMTEDEVKLIRDYIIGIKDDKEKIDKIRNDLDGSKSKEETKGILRKLIPNTKADDIPPVSDMDETILKAQFEEALTTANFVKNITPLKNGIGIDPMVVNDKLLQMAARYQYSLPDVLTASSTTESDYDPLSHNEFLAYMANLHSILLAFEELFNAKPEIKKPKKYEAAPYKVFLQNSTEAARKLNKVVNNNMVLKGGNSKSNDATKNSETPTEPTSYEKLLKTHPILAKALKDNVKSEKALLIYSKTAADLQVLKQKETDIASIISDVKEIKFFNSVNPKNKLIFVAALLEAGLSKNRIKPILMAIMTNGIGSNFGTMSPFDDVKALVEKVQSFKTPDEIIAYFSAMKSEIFNKRIF